MHNFCAKPCSWHQHLQTYIDQTLLDLSEQERGELKKRIEQNVTGVISVLLLLRSFGREHSQIFRRYKHVGIW